MNLLEYYMVVSGVIVGLFIFMWVFYYIDKLFNWIKEMIDSIEKLKNK